MSEPAPDRRPARVRRVVAWSAHLLTASGALWGILALDAIVGARLRAALGWMALAVVVDAVDGALARVARARAHAPAIDGALLDNLVDFLNYVIVPAFLLHDAGLLPEPFALPAAGAIGIASAFQFAHVEAKTADHYFRGFPCYWNVLALYLLLLRPDPRVALALVVVLCGAACAPLRFVYPTRTRRLRAVTLALAGIWAVLLGLLLLRFPRHDVRLAYASLAFPAYYVALSLWLERERFGSPAGSCRTGPGNGSPA